MASQSNVQALLDARSKLFGSACERLDVESVLFWHSDAILFHDTAVDQYSMNRSGVRDFLGKMFADLQSLRVVEARTTGSATHCVWETLLEVANKADDAHLGVVAGQKTLLRGASVWEWRWEGPGGAWDGSLEEESVRGWKIVRDHEYAMVVKDGSAGEKVMML